MPSPSSAGQYALANSYELYCTYLIHFMGLYIPCMAANRKCSLQFALLQIMCRLGCPKTLITDQGREFVNQLTSHLFAKTNTEHRITCAYHPQVHA